MRKKVFCDFDGTVARNDVGDQLFHTFTDGRSAEPVQRWLRDEISSKECLTAKCSLARASLEELERFVNSQELDPHFSEFARYCRMMGIPIVILSDGLDFYIERILGRFGYSDIQFFSNHLVFQDENLVAEFPYYDEGCKKCGNCKGYHVKRLREDGDLVIYVGDGYSDRCGVEASDVILAKRDLSKYCRENGIHYYEYEHFGDVLNIIQAL